MRQLLALAALTTLLGSAAAAEGTPAAATPYPFATCIVSGEALGGAMGEPVVFVHEGREVKLCCRGCLKAFRADPAKALAAIDAGAKAVAAGGTPVNPAAAALAAEPAADASACGCCQ